jgi:hypothetical protein
VQHCASLSDVNLKDFASCPRRREVALANHVWRASSVFSDIMSRASAASVCGSLLPVAMVTLPSLTRRSPCE